MRTAALMQDLRAPLGLDQPEGVGNDAIEDLRAQATPHHQHLQRTAALTVAQFGGRNGGNGAVDRIAHPDRP